ncbi:MAG: DUF721 domain-containing protein [Gemmatimonadaceae bacterium]
MPNDRRPPSTIADALKGFLKQSGLGVRVQQAEVVQLWPQLVGPEIAGATQALAVSPDGVLFVAVRSHAWMNELSMMERELLEVVNRVTPTAPLRGIRLQLAR